MNSTRTWNRGKFSDVHFLDLIMLCCSYSAAKLSMMKRAAQVAAVGENLQRDMKLLCVTGRWPLCR